MKEEKEDYYSLGEIVKNIKSFLQYLCKRWWRLALAMLAGAGLGIIYYYIQKPKYEAVTTFILEEKSAGGNGLAGLASQFGFSLGGMSGGGSIFAGDNILVILKSKKIVEEVLLSEADSGSNNSLSLADYYLEFTGTRKNWQKKPALADINFGNIKNKLTPLQDSVLNVIYERITKVHLVTERLSKQSSVIRVKITAADGPFARLMSERLVNEAAKLYMDIRIGTAQENIRQMQRESDSLLHLLTSKTYSTAASQLLDVNPGIKTAIVPAEIASRDKTVLATMYAEVVKNLEASKVLLSQETPVIQLLDTPAHLLKDNRIGILLLLLVFSFVAGSLYIAATFLKYLIS
jgi:uncharacterized protein involved in exopolysaccharide biosynthesis